jgi:hypothetical protein
MRRLKPSANSTSAPVPDKTNITNILLSAILSGRGDELIELARTTLLK